jgi:hypothetical protein
MSTTIELPTEVQVRLEAEAGRRGITVAELISQLAEHLPVRLPEVARRRPAFVGIGSSTSGRSAREAEEMLAEGFGRD